MGGGTNMGRDYFHDIFGTQPRGAFQQPRASDFDQFWDPNRMRQPASPNESRGEGERSKGTARKVEETPTGRNVRTIVVEDGGAKEAPSRKAPPQAPQSQKTPQAPKAPPKAPRAPQGRKAPPVRFESLDAAASKIQAVYRGYSMRRTEPLKHLRLICKVKSELQELVRKSCRPEEMEKLRDDPQVRLRWTEGIMELILRLDSLQGVHPLVRVSRKSMAKDLLRFQERIDSMADAAKENLVVDYVDPVEEDSNVEAENKDIAIAEDTNVPDLETEKETALETEDSSDSSVSPVPEESIQAVSSNFQMIDIADNLQVTSVKSTPGTESLIETPENCQTSVSENVQERLICRNYNAEVKNAKEAAACTYLPAGDLEQAADGYTGDVSISTEDQELNTSPVDASNDAMFVANPYWTTLITEARQGDSLSYPSTTTDDFSLSDRALLLQILEENRKLQALFGEVLQWGEQQNEVINKLTTRVKQLEGEVSNVKLLKDCIHSSGKRADSIAIPIGNRERLVRILETSYGPQTNFINADEQRSSSVASEEFF